jgi:hypothetical protein
MNGTFRNLTLTAVLLSFSISAYAAGTPEADEALPETSVFIRQALAQANDPSTREAAVDSLLANIENYQEPLGNKGPYENNLKARLKAIDSIWTLGEIGDPRLMGKLSKFYSEADDVVKVNLIISMGKLKKNQKSGPYIFDIAASAQENAVVRAVAFEMLEHIGYPSTVLSLTPSKNAGIEKGDIIYTGGIIGTIGSWGNPDLPIGHAGLFAGTEIKNGRINIIITDCVPNNFKPGGVRNIYSWKNFTHQYMYPYYGNRTTTPRPTAEQRERLVKLGLELGAKGLKYSNTHFSQKGPLLFDCVGYIEYIYERTGLNPTDDSYESGAGWPLTPWEQFAATRPNTPAAGTIVLPNNGNIIIPNQAIITQGFGSLTGAFGGKAVQAPEVNTDIRPELLN